MVEKKLYLISCLFLLSISLLNWYLKSNISWIIFFISIVTLYISLKYKLKYKVGNKISVITQAGFDEKQQWEGLKNYLEDLIIMDYDGGSHIDIYEKCDLSIMFLKFNF